ncbi:H-2 class I histocompatibility antigen, K-D alpha chain-like [Clarias gariepinus]|uniref:H-2 class I histocompatibility antigen, K-D alpha chain-like n=1 Tax=Clarias gariepinus TaxID=13013 RepID=UPI00234DDCDF|nr:H-2 class I histocompatibility antigen, K-D alpha chain-like [Clarias gariepinus]
MKNVEADDREYWRRETERVQNDQHWLQEKEQSFNQTKGVSTLTRMYGCDLNSNGTTRGYDQYDYDGEDFISLNPTTETWTAANDKAKMFIKEWDTEGEMAKHWKDFLEKDCIDQLKKFGCDSNGTLDRTEAVCHATGFFPKAVMITWQKDGLDVHEDVDLGRTLPSEDGNFQKRSVLKVPTGDLWKHNYTCVVQHSSLEKKIVLEVPQGGESDAEPGGGLKGKQIAIIVAVVIGLGIVAYVCKNLPHNLSVCDLSITWHRHGEDVHEDMVELREMTRMDVFRREAF